MKKFIAILLVFGIAVLLNLGFSLGLACLIKWAIPMEITTIKLAVMLMLILRSISWAKNR